MKRWSIAVLILTFCATIAFAQEPTRPGQMFSSDLVAWSFMQQPQAPERSQSQPQAKPEPTPETQPSQNPTPAEPGEQHASPESQTEPSAHTFTGTISKEADSYVLKVSDSTSYKLDNEQQVQPYEGRRVQVTGTLDRSINLIHVEKIEPMS